MCTIQLQYNIIKYNAINPMQYKNNYKTIQSSEITIQHNTIAWYTRHYGTIEYIYNTIQLQYSPIQYNTIQYNTIQYNTIQNTILHKNIQLQ